MFYFLNNICKISFFFLLKYFFVNYFAQKLIIPLNSYKIHKYLPSKASLLRKSSTGRVVLFLSFFLPAAEH